jgi:hypothetical protein
MNFNSTQILHYDFYKKITLGNKSRFIKIFIEL